jgi:TonB family protein
MRRTTMIAAASFAAAFLLGVGVGAAAEKAVPERALPEATAAAGIDGPYLADGDARHPLTISLIADGTYRVEAERWVGVGLSDGKRYWGVYRYRDGVTPPTGAASSGTHLGSVGTDGSIHIHGESANGPGQSFDMVWKPAGRRPPNDRRGVPMPGFQHPVWPPDRPPIPVAPEGPRIEVAPPAVPRESLPNLGDYVYVEELPEAIKKVPPVYPELPRTVDATVLVQALVGKDGLVKETRVIKSVPLLDQAAVESVRQWVFKPAKTKGKPVAVWVAIPVRFASP